MKYVLLGSLGNITEPTAKQLIAKGHDVTIVSSKSDKQTQIEALGAKAAIGDVHDVPFLTQTFAGADALYLMIPPVWEVEEWKKYIHQVGKGYAQAVRESGVKKVVNLSSIGAHMPDGCGPVSGIHFAEEELNQLSGVDVLHVQPGYFYNNFFAAVGMIKQAGIFGNNFSADSEIILVHPLDIADTVADALLNPTFTGKSVRYIAGDRRTSKEVAAVLGAAIGKPELPYVEFTNEQAFEGGKQAGLVPEVSFNYAEMGKAIRTGEMYEIFNREGNVTGKIKLEDFAADFAKAF